MWAGKAPVPARSRSTVDEELERVIPVIKRLSAELDLVISIDTYKAPVARGCAAFWRAHGQ